MSDLETSEPAHPDMMDMSKSIVQKRRSSIFQRRSINPRQQDCDETITEEQKPPAIQINQEEPQKDTFDLSKYISSLQHEQQTWKKTLNERKFQRRCLVKEETRVHDGVDLDLTCLTDYEKSFISDRPNYEGISDNMENLSNAAVKTAALYTLVNGLNEAIVERLNGEISRVKSKLIDLSDV